MTQKEDVMTFLRETFNMDYSTRNLISNIYDYLEKNNYSIVSESDYSAQHEAFLDEFSDLLDGTGIEFDYNEFHEWNISKLIEKEEMEL